jgi:dynein heavy chain
VKHLIEEAVGQYSHMDRPKFIYEYQGQVVITGCQTWWCQEVSDALQALSNGQGDALEEYNKVQEAQLSELIGEVRTKLTKGDRQKVMNIITLDAHARDIISILIAEEVASLDAFLWQSQLRYTWDTGKRDCCIYICDAHFVYAYEYLGNGPRLVITPLTDRIYITATQALHLVLGCAPAGPAGTGKTETTKDLSSQCGVACYVFNCSDQMDYRSMADIFKGLASSGSWGCFDEFNRISPEVLSVCSVQVKIVLPATPTC